MESAGNSAIQAGKRILWLDCLKGMLIIMMVLGHSGAPFITYIYMMHMPAFLWASGYTSYSSRNREGYRTWTYIRKRIFSLLIPAFAINLVFIVFYWLMNQCGAYSLLQSGEYTSLTENVLLLMRNLISPDFGGATWFLFVLFEVEVLFSLFYWISRKMHASWLVYCLCLICGLVGDYFANNGIYLPYLFDLALLACLYYGIGFMMAKHDVLKHLDARILFPLCLLFTIFFGSFWFKGQLPMNWPTRQFSDLFIQLLSCFSCMYIVYTIAQWLCTNPLHRLFVYIGQRTYAILVLHFCMFRVIFYLYYLWGQLTGSGIPITYLQNLTPTYELNKNGGWLLLTVLNIALCLLISKLSTKTRGLNYLFNGKLGKSRRVAS